MVALTRFIGLMLPWVWVRMVRMPHAASTSRTPGPDLTPVPGPAGTRITRLPPKRPLSFFFSSRRRHTSWTGDWSSDVCSSDLGENDDVTLYFPFRDFTGRYPMHCHNIIHEDHAMMLRFDIDDVGNNNESSCGFRR